MYPHRGKRRLRWYSDEQDQLGRSEDKRHDHPTGPGVAERHAPRELGSVRSTRRCDSEQCPLGCGFVHYPE